VRLLSVVALPTSWGRAALGRFDGERLGGSFNMTQQVASNFLSLVKKSGLVAPDQLARFINDVKREQGGPPDDKLLGNLLVAAGLVTPWQNDKLQAGRHKGFFLGRYRLLTLLGTGGMSSVFLAEHTLMRRRVAIKVLPVERNNESSYRERFLLEARAIASLDHPNIVQAYSVDKDGKVYYMVMEYVDGLDLQKIASQEGPLDYARAVRYIRQAAEGLDHAHGRQMIHRDIKPANLLVNRQDTIKILDMGLARLTGKDETSLTIDHNENVLGTTDYLSPEQALDSHNVDHRTDIYSLGCTLYHLLMGHPPFPEGTMAQRLMKHQIEEPKDIALLRPDAPPALLAICRKMMAKKREQRYQSAAELAQVLKDWEADQGSASDSGSGSKRKGSSATRQSTAVNAEAPTTITKQDMISAPGVPQAKPARQAPSPAAGPPVARPISKAAPAPLPPAPALPVEASRPSAVAAPYVEEALTGFLANLDQEAEEDPSMSSAYIPTQRPESLPPWVWAATGAVVLAVLIGSYLLLANRRSDAPHKPPRTLPNSGEWNGKKVDSTPPHALPPVVSAGATPRPAPPAATPPAVVAKAPPPAPAPPANTPTEVVRTSRNIADLVNPNDEHRENLLANPSFENNSASDDNFTLAGEPGAQLVADWKVDSPGVGVAKGNGGGIGDDKSVICPDGNSWLMMQSNKPEGVTCRLTQDVMLEAGHRYEVSGVYRRRTGAAAPKGKLVVAFGDAEVASVDRLDVFDWTRFHGEYTPADAGAKTLSLTYAGMGGEDMSIFIDAVRLVDRSK